MNNVLLEAGRTPAVLEERNGKQYLIRSEMVKAISEICDEIDEALTRLPALLGKYGLAEYDCEALQRSILSEGFGAVQDAVLASTRERLKGTGLFPQMVEKVAVQNLDCIPLGLRDELENTRGEINGFNRDLDFPVDYNTLFFDGGKLRISDKYRGEIAARYTVEVSAEDIKTVQKMREASALLAELKGRGVQIGDELRIPPRGGHPVLYPGLVGRMANGSKYTDAELLGLICMGIGLQQ